MKISASKRIYAAGEDDEEVEDNDLPEFDYDSMMDSDPDGSPAGGSDLDPDLDESEIEEDEETQEDLTDDIPEDAVSIVTDNNIEGHYIAECESCSGIFISSVIKSDDSKIESISGECPLCGKHTEQYLRWVIESNETDDSAI